MTDHRSRRAAEILAEEVFTEALEAARKRIKDEWAQCTAPQAREALWHQYQALESGITRELRAIRDKGKANKADR